MLNASHPPGDVTAMITVLAHQGGWDEILMVAVPVAVFALLLYIANNRASKMADESTSEAQTASTSNAPDSGTAAQESSAGRASEAKKTRSRQPQNPRRGPI